MGVGPHGFVRGEVTPGCVIAAVSWVQHAGLSAAPTSTR